MDESLKDRTSIPTTHLVELVELCLRTTYFQFEDKFYEQSEGAAMESPLSPVIANLYMEYLEETALQAAPLCPRLWLHYVDDTFVIKFWPHGPDELICRQHPNIRFTIEQEKEGRLAFLDVQVTRSLEGLTTSVYRKPTHTDRYIPFHSHHHQRTITSALRCMRDRAHQICDTTHKGPELQQLQHVFQANGFPEELVRETLGRRPLSTTPSGSTRDEPPKILCVPYVRGLSEN